MIFSEEPTYLHICTLMGVFMESPYFSSVRDYKLRCQIWLTMSKRRGFLFEHQFKFNIHCLRPSDGIGLSWLIFYSFNHHRDIFRAV